MSIRVEFYGIPRKRAGVEATTINVGAKGLTLSRLLSEIASEFPDLAMDCITGETLRAGYTASIDGERFVSAPDEIVPSGTSLLIMSADAGG